MAPQALYRTCSNGYNFISKIESGALRNCISKSLWDRIKVSNKLAKSHLVLTGAGGSKLSLLGFANITCTIGKFTFTEEFAVIDGMVSDMLLGIKWEHRYNIHTGWTRNGSHYISRGKHDFIAESMHRIKMHPIIKMKGKVELNPESITLIEVQAPRDIIGNRKYQLNPEGYLAQGIIPLDLVHSFDKTPRTLYIPILNTSDKYKSIAKSSLLGTFEPIDEEISDVRETSWTDLDGKMRQAHQQLRKKKSYRQARQKCFDGQKYSEKLLPDYPVDSNMEMETMMKCPDTVLEDSKDADKWKIKVLNMLESTFGSIISRSSTDVGRTKSHTLNVQVTEGSPVFVKQYTIPLKYQNFIDNETKTLEEAGLISRSLSNWSAPCIVVPKKQDPDNPREVQLQMVIDYRQLNKRIITSRAPDRNVNLTGGLMFCLSLKYHLDGELLHMRLSLRLFSTFPKGLI